MPTALGLDEHISTLLSVLYVSSATASFSDSQLIDFLRAWRDFNSAHAVTGFLLYEKGNFMQALEGPALDVNRLIDNIRDDPRNKGMIILWKKTITQREFPTWCMGFRKSSDLSPEDQRAFSSLLDDVHEDEKFRSNPGAGHKMLAQFKNVCVPQYKA